MVRELKLDRMVLVRITSRYPICLCEMKLRREMDSLGTYKNPILYADYSDPDVVRVGGD